MESLIKEMEDRLEQLKIGYETQKLNIAMQEGAITECESIIELLKHKEKKNEV